MHGNPKHIQKETKIWLLGYTLCVCYLHNISFYGIFFLKIALLYPNIYTKEKNNVYKRLNKLNLVT